jgi:hypothetical protein
VGTVGVVVGVVVGSVGAVADGAVSVVLGVVGAVAAGTVTVVAGGVDLGVSSSATSAKAIPAASSVSTTTVSATGTRQLGGGWMRVRAASPHSRHQL